MPFGLICAQLIHAAGESSPGGLPDGTFAVALAAKNETELLAIECRLLDADVSLRSIREPDLGGSLTALGLTPAPKSKLYRLLSSIPLLKEVA